MWLSKLSSPTHKMDANPILSSQLTQNTDIINKNKNYTRVKNKTNIQFTHEEIQILNKGLKYNLHYKSKNWIETLALEAQTAISDLEITEQNYYRHAVAREKQK
jgi:hypothetical protein